MNKTCELKCGDIVFYTDEVGKKRPLVYLKSVNNGRAVVGVKCTSRTRNYNLYSFYIPDWKEIGLMKETSVRCDKIRFLSDSDLHRYNQTSDYEYVGRLGTKSLNNVITLFEAYSDELRGVANDIKGKQVYAIKETEMFDDDSFTTFSVFEDEEKAREMFKLCCGESIKTILHGKLVNVNKTYELGTVNVLNRDEVDENTFTMLEKSSPNICKSKSVHKSV